MKLVMIWAFGTENGFILWKNHNDELHRDNLSIHLAINDIPGQTLINWGFNNQICCLHCSRILLLLFLDELNQLCLIEKFCFNVQIRLSIVSTEIYLFTYG
ncbi:hypothetical protein RF11_12748 [Thelohanellus kitauei]|uniref:Uncharacterized protein n=1 Tax=Thelohanellus kitauei TaxID=669202 RepID=A0A0C2MAI7_THEKT|nr:hypothetical protein RF11_12748 [Thelohanellus kitauei]